jgi:hypothetical protein
VLRAARVTHVHRKLTSYNLGHCLRVLVEETTKEGWSIKRLQERVLKVAARFLIHGRRVTVVINDQAAELWQRIRAPLARLQWAT